MPLTVTLDDTTPDAINTALRGSDLSPAVTVHPVSDDVVHAVLTDGSVLVVRRYSADCAIVYLPVDYANVDLTRVRDSSVAAIWDVQATVARPAYPQQLAAVAA